MNMIVAVDKNWAIGCGNKLLVSIPADMKYFRETTTGKVVVMGRKTLESLPGGKPLKNRENIVLTMSPAFQADGATIVHSLAEMQAELEQHNTRDVYVIGGESIYRLLLPYCDTAYVTKINHAYDADTYFPNLDEMDDWKLAGVSAEQTYFDLEYVFARYERREIKGE